MRIPITLFVPGERRCVLDRFRFWPVCRGFQVYCCNKPLSEETPRSLEQGRANQGNNGTLNNFDKLDKIIGENNIRCSNNVECR